MKRRDTLVTIMIIIVFGVGTIYFLLNNKLSQTATTITEDLTTEQYESPGPLKQFDEHYDVIVIGGEPEGVAAAVSAARNGAKTLLIENRKELGGLFTYGMLNFLDIPQGADGKSVSRGIFEEWHHMVGAGSAFGILEAKAAFKKLVDQENNLTLTTETEVINAHMNNNKIEGVTIQNENGTFHTFGETFIDATQDADFAVMTGVPYFIGGEDIGQKDKKMSVTLIIHLKNVNWEGIREAVKSEKFGYAAMKEDAAWGFSKLLTAYQPVEENTRLRGLNLAKVGDEYFINALQIFGVDGLDENSKKDAIEKGKRETEHILTFLKKEFPGFEQAEIASFPTELYIRETRHIRSEYQLPMSDVWTNLDHWDAIAYGAYPVDIQAQTPQDYGYVMANPKQYAIPFRSLIPKQIDGLLVVGRSSGYSSLAAGSARIVPTGMTTGEAAGAAAAIAVKKGVTFRQMSQDKDLVQLLQKTLEEQNAYRKPTDTSYPYEGEWFDEQVQFLIDYGLVYGGYDNDLRVDETATFHSFINLLHNGFLRMQTSIPKDLYNRFVEKRNEILVEEDHPITRDQLATLLVEVLFGKEKMEATFAHWSVLLEEKIITEPISKHISRDEQLTRKEIFAITASILSQFYLQ
ncbi:FAD-dependent oxidoreductase [Fervidibacillus halotolerans]|uniref:FAD-dependent oxidoreductase n=1 Tax=Fervidibacillus halotolerans TaxID=2980027 RepID=A0A9E8LYM8_9BACI|nr:FAD-dependent oxidoreductase [Fervidibacillus halotolerans]WAA12132.1 FAD-dependent oxidoreductase [Fervidibacillus halotolerans]